MLTQNPRNPAFARGFQGSLKVAGQRSAKGRQSVIQTIYSDYSGPVGTCKTLLGVICLFNQGSLMNTQVRDRMFKTFLRVTGDRPRRFNGNRRAACCGNDLTDGPRLGPGFVSPVRGATVPTNLSRPCRPDSPVPRPASRHRRR